MSTQGVDAFLEHYGVKGMRWGVRKTPSVRQVRREQRIGNKLANRGDKKADKLLKKAKKREAQSKRQHESIVERQAQLDRMRSGKKTTDDLLEMVGSFNIATLAGAAVNRQSYSKQHADDQQNVLEGYKKGLARRDAKTKEMRQRAMRERRGATLVRKQMDELGQMYLPKD